MRSSIIKLAVLSTLGLATVQAYAAFVALPSAGSAVALSANQPAGTTAYKRFFNHASSNFGSEVSNPAYVLGAFPGDTAGPTGGNASLPPAPYNTAGWGGAGNTASTTGSITENGVIVANYTSRVWRNAALGQCVYGFQIVNTLNDYLTGTAGVQTIEFNDIAMGGFTGRAVDAAYWKHISTSSVVYRAGLTFSAVQHRAAPLWTAGPNTGYVALPLTSPAFALSINGLNAAPGGTPIAAQQSASINDNWVDFTLDVNSKDDDGSSSASSPWLYVHSTCATGSLVSSSNAVRVRQTYQENAFGGTAANSFREFGLTGYTPANNGVAVTPAPVAPF